MTRAMIDPNSPIYTFGYEKLKKPEYKYIKDSKKQIHMIKVVEYITQHGSSYNEKEQYRYAKYQVRVKKTLQSKLRRILNVIQSKEDKVQYNWLQIEPQLYISGLYMNYSPSGMVQEECLYDTYEEALDGESSNIFRNYNLQKKENKFNR